MTNNLIAISFKNIDVELYKRFKMLCVEQGVEMHVKIQDIMEKEIKARDSAKRQGL